ncbi:unnamed protein product [Calypogeia fissa]
MAAVVWYLMATVKYILFILINRAGATNFLLNSATDTASSSPIAAGRCSRSDPKMDPFYETRYGQQMVWQIPPSPKAVLFLAHGKDKEPLSYFDPGPNCRECYGFPEDRAATLEALERSYAVIMVKSVDTYWLPYNVMEWPPPPSQDRTIVVSIIREWTKEHMLEDLPLVAFGHSSGGNFTTLLTVDLDIKSMILMCSPGEFAVLHNANAGVFPPALFVPMPLDNATTGFYPKVVHAINILNSKGVLVKEIDAWPMPIHPHSFSDKIPCLQAGTSEQIYAALKSEGWLGEGDYMIKSPYTNDWEAVLRRQKVLRMCQSWSDMCFAEHIRQVLMAAWAEHSFTSSLNEEIFNWLDDSMLVGSFEEVRLKMVTD